SIITVATALYKCMEPGGWTSNCNQEVQNFVQMFERVKKLVPIEDKDSSLGIGMVNGGTFNTDLSPKQDQESDDDFQLVTPISQKRKKQLSLSKKDKKSNVLVKKAKTTNRNTDDDIDDPFISDNDLAESSEFLKDNSSSSNLDSISPDPKESKEIRKLTQ
ncbi:14596_t:CDS:2, partial [Entrophospora sp. SA101]